MSSAATVPPSSDPATGSASPAPWLQPIASIGGLVISVILYLGGLADLAGSAIRATFRPRGEVVPFVPATFRNLDRMLMMCFPLAAIIHVGLGSFLAMQAYFGATFVDGIGPVVGVGLVRNIAPLMSAFVMAGMFSAVLTSELRSRQRLFLIDEPEWVPDRGGLPGSRVHTEVPRLVATRLAAAILAGPVLALWASAVGIVVGWAVGGTLLGVTTPGFFDLFVEMLWVRDVIGLVCKGMLFGVAAAIFPCYEGVRNADDSTFLDPAPALRAACLAGITILFINSAWFLLFYHAGPAFGPTVLTPPHQ